jgi:hypothetical protein
VESVERWVPIPEWEGLYEASDQGRIRSLDRPGHRGRILVPSSARDGYYRVDLCRNGKSIHYLVHRLVLAAFVGPRPDGMEALHGPGGGKDNRLANLSYGTHSQNCLDKRRDDSNPNGEMCWQAKLTAADVEEIRQRAVGRERGFITTLAAEYGLSRSGMRNIVNGKNWKTPSSVLLRE